MTRRYFAAAFASLLASLQSGQYLRRLAGLRLLGLAPRASFRPRLWRRRHPRDSLPPLAKFWTIGSPSCVR